LHDNAIKSLLTAWSDGSTIAICTKEREKKSIYIVAFILRIVSKHSDMDHTVLPANYTMPAFF